MPSLPGVFAFSAVLSTEGRVVGLCWEKLYPKGPKANWAVSQEFIESTDDEKDKKLWNILQVLLHKPAKARL